MARILRAFQALSRRHPRIGYVRLGPERVFLLSHPELVHQVFVRNGRAVRKGRTSDAIKAVLGEGLLTSEGDLHRQQRRLIQPGLRADRVAEYRDLIEQTASDWGDSWVPGRSVDITREMSALTLTVISRVLFGRSLRREDIDQVAECLGAMLGGRPWQMLPGANAVLSLPLPSIRRRFQAAERLRALTQRLIDERSGGMVNAFEQLSETQRRDEAITLLLAGHETTATSLSWTWLLLSEHPTVADRLVGADGAADPEWVRAVFAESLRLFPPSWILARRPVTDLTVDDRTIPAGALAVACTWSLHRDPRFWPDAEAFRPERWMADGVFSSTAPNVPKGTWLPFGIGSRACVGQDFAWLEGTTVLDTLLPDWRPRLDDHARGRVRARPSTTLRPADELPMTLRPAARPS